MQTVIQDSRYAFRMFLKNPGFTIVALITLALGIGASTAIFSVVYGVLLRPLPYDKPDQIVRVWEADASGQRMNFSDPNFEDVRTQSQSLQGLAEFGSSPESVSVDSDASRIMVASVTKDFFNIMRIHPVLGRSFFDEDHRLGAAPLALVSYGYWKQVLSGSTNLSAIKLDILSKPFSVVGVLPAGFDFPDRSQIWIPRELFEQVPARDAHNWEVIGRLRDGITEKQAHVELTTIARRLKQQYGRDMTMTDVSIAQLQREITNPVRPGLIVLLTAVGFLLLVAGLNVANLLLAQATARQRELAIRVAAGATRARLVNQFMVEALILSFSGGLLGILITRWTLVGLLKLAPADLVRLGTVSVNLPVLFFALVLSALVAVGLGVFSALRGVSGSPYSALSEGGRSQAGTLSSQRVGKIIVAGQLAFTLTLLMGAGLLGRSLLHVLSINPGFRTENVLTMDLALSFVVQENDKLRRAQLITDLLTELRKIPGVTDAGGTGRLPFSAPLSDGTYAVLAPGQQVPTSMGDLLQLLKTSTHTGYAAYSPVSEGFFTSLGIPLLGGRLFDDHDGMSAPHVALISDSLAREKWPSQDPVGARIEFGNMDGDLRPLTVVGVVGDVRADGLEIRPQPTIYVNYRQRPQATQHFTAVLHTSSDPSNVISAAREVVRKLDPGVPPELGSFVQIVSTSLQSRRFNLFLVGFFSGAALLLAAVGLYGIMAYSVTRRTREIGVRIALGATPRNILRVVLRQGIIVIIPGVLIGLVGSFLLTRTIRSLLFGLSPADPVTFGGVVALLVLVALIACLVPARRAARINPIEALRYE